LWYRAPEILLGVTKYGPKVDIWSAGCIFIELLTRRSPFPGKNEKNQMDLIFKLCGTPNEHNWNGVSKLPEYKTMRTLPQYFNRLEEQFRGIDRNALDLLKKMLTLDPEKRITASEALDHDYFWTDPMPCSPSQFPKYPSMHEFEAKRSRQEPVVNAPRPPAQIVPPVVQENKNTAASRLGKPKPPPTAVAVVPAGVKTMVHNMHHNGVRHEPMKRTASSTSRNSSRPDHHRDHRERVSHPTRSGHPKSSSRTSRRETASNSMSPPSRRPPSDHETREDSKSMAMDTSSSRDLAPRKRKREVSG